MAKKGRAQVWLYFRKEGDKTVVCGICGQKLAFRSSTTTMRYHLDRKHPMQWSLANKNSLTDVSTADAGALVVSKPDTGTVNLPVTSGNYKTNSKSVKGLANKEALPSTTLTASGNAAKTAAITYFITEMIIKDLLPFREVEKSGFRQLLKYLEPGYTVPTRGSIMDSLNRLYEEIKPNVQEAINNAPFIALTSEVWSSCTTQLYMSISAYWVTEDWTLTSRLLATRALSTGYSFEEVATWLQEILGDYGVTLGKVSAIVHSDCVEYPTQVAGIPVIPCFAFVLQRIINRAFQLEPIASLINAVRRLVGNVTHLSGSIIELAMQQSEIKVSELKLEQDINTQWFSTCVMLENLHNQRQILCAMVGDEQITRASGGLLGQMSERWDLIAEVVDILHPLRTVTEVMSGSKNVSVSTVVPILHGLTTVHLAEKPGDSLVAKSFKNILRSEILHWWPLELLEFVESVPVVASLLDPRYRDPSHLTIGQQQTVRATLSKRLASNCLRGNVSLVSSQNGMETPEVRVNGSSSSRMNLSALEFLLGRHMLMESTSLPGEDGQAESELKLYMDPVLNPPAATDCDPMLWWQGNRKRFPLLSNVARQYLCVPSTAIPTKRLFSKEALNFDSTRALLEPDSLDMVLFLHYNMPSLN